MDRAHDVLVCPYETGRWRQWVYTNTNVHLKRENENHFLGDVTHSCGRSVHIRRPTLMFINPPNPEIV